MVPWPVAMLLPLRSHHAEPGSPRPPLLPAPVPPRAQAAATAPASGLGTRGHVLLGPRGKAFVVKQGLSTPRVKNHLGEDETQEHDFELFTPAL